ncbi:HIT domain-containing protein [Ureaplasma miroungigenitalium]|uniref:HIT domain-containing protein n=1 Tax=Ureaplasma miroungigenitalium TaxID=1042321 RepID=A0ABT3BNS3_9BACT|nr:HIT domain-containing protein [Ureaplasma miroungigenitalium]MCV3728751.1 HIT domain-containing protein [Ureaplasma miroungigenitalium]MCV3734523.1 HIT domain-containing protein [Ureaplasma miroungigenitalium]
MADCLFCQIVDKKISAQIVDENDDVMGFLDISPAAPGHLLIIPKKHYANFGLTEVSYLEKMMHMAKNLTFALEDALENVAGFNYLINSYPAAGQVIMHTHLHIIPKYAKDEGFYFGANKKTLSDEEQTAANQQIFKKVSRVVQKQKKSRLGKHFLV